MKIFSMLYGSVYDFSELLGCLVGGAGVIVVGVGVGGWGRGGGGGGGGGGKQPRLKVELDF